MPIHAVPVRCLVPVLWLALVVVSSLASAWQIPSPVLDAETRLNWHARHLQMRDESPVTTKWQFIGPELMSGRVTDIAAAADEPFTFYVATASGGVWKTTNEGTTWTPVFDDAPSGSVGTIAVGPVPQKTVWVGLGEANIFRSSMAGTGVYRSDDGGTTWQHCGLADTGHIGRIVVDPEDPDTVYVAASGHQYRPNPERGIFKTVDGGQSWTKVLFLANHIGAIDLIISPDDRQTLYAAMWNRTRRPWSDPVAGPDDGIFKSVDGGNTWQPLTAGLPDSSSTGRIGLAISPADPDVVYAVIDNHEIARQPEENERDNYGRQRQAVKKGAEVYRSSDRGLTWQLASVDDRQMSRVFATYGWVFGQIRVDPNNVDTVFVLGVPLLKSIDGGQSFQRVSFRGLHGDHHAMWINPANSQHIINGNDGGINISYDGGETWKDLDNLPVVQFYNVEVDNATPFRVYGSIQDNNSWRGPSSYRAGRSPLHEWQRIPGGEASTMAIDPQDENIFYSEGFYGSIQRSTLEPRKTTSIKPESAEGEPPLRGQWLAPFILSPHNSQIIYHGMQYVFRSLDQGQTWQRISDDLTNLDPECQGNIPYATITALSESPLKFGLLYAGTDDGRLHVTRDGGQTWTEITDGVPVKWVSRVVASRYDEGTVFATFNGKRDDDFQVYVFRSPDYGATWTDIGGGIPGGPVNVILEDPFYPGILYVGTDMGVYATIDGGTSWFVPGRGLPITFVHDLALQERDQVLVAATHGRGMYTLRLRRLYSEYRKANPDVPARELNADEEPGQPAEQSRRAGDQPKEDDDDGDDGTDDGRNTVQPD